MSYISAVLQSTLMHLDTPFLPYNFKLKPVSISTLETTLKSSRINYLHLSYKIIGYNYN